MRMTTIAVTLLALGGCHKGGSATDETTPNGTKPRDETGLTPVQAERMENQAGSYPAGPTVVPGATGVGATGVEEPIDQPPAPDTPTH